MNRKPGKRFTAVLAALALSSLAAASLGSAAIDNLSPTGFPSGAILFRINGSPVEEREFRRFLEIAFREEPDPSASRLPVLADSFINNRLLAAGARAEGVDKLPAVRSRIETRLNRLWPGVLWEEVVKPSLRIEEKDLADMVPAMEDAVSLQQLTVESRERAEELRSLALAGGDFGEIIMAESVGLTSHKGGMLGFVTKRSSLYDPELLDLLFRMRPGDYSAVSRTATGYAVIRVLEKKPAARMRQEWLDANRGRLVRIREQDAWKAWKEKLARSCESAVNQEAVDAYLKAREKNGPLGPALAMTAVTVDGVPLTLRDLIDPSGLGVVHSDDTVQTIIRRRVEEFALAREAGRRGLREKHPDLLLTERLLGEYLLAREYLEFRSRDLTVTEDERREYYEANRKKFVAPRAFRLSLIETRSPARLRTIYDLLDKGTPFEEVADRWSDNRDAIEGASGFVEENRIPPELAPATRLAIGEHLRTPLRIKPAEGGEGVWIVPRLIAVREERQLPFEETDRASLAKSVMAQKRERLIRSVLADLRRENRIELSREFAEFAKRGINAKPAKGDNR